VTYQSYDALIVAILLVRKSEAIMDDKALTAVATSLALMQIQVNALMLLLERHTPGVPIKEEFQGLISEGVQTVGVETMEGIKKRIYEGIIQQQQGETGNGHH
jgi:hypothetical protein